MPYSKDGPHKKFFSGTQKYFLTTKKKISQNQEKIFWDQKKSWDEKKFFFLQVGQKNFLDLEKFFGFFSLGDQKKSYENISWTCRIIACSLTVLVYSMISCHMRLRTCSKAQATIASLTSNYGRHIYKHI